MSKVLCVDRPVCLMTTSLRDPTRWIKQIAGLDRLRKLSENLFVYRPWVFVHDHVAAKLPIMPVLNQEWLSRQLKVVINSLGLRQDRLIAWIYDPFQEEYLGLLSERLLVYECYDEYSAWAGMPFFRTESDLVARERRILSRVDVVLVVSEALYQKKCQFNKNVYIVPNAADVRHFGLARDEATTIPEDVISINHPIIGLVGDITGRIDLGLLAELADTHSEWSVVVVGGLTDSLSGGPADRKTIARLRRLPNVLLLGARPYKTLPGYLKAFDVCLIPYTPAHPFNIHCSPLKLYEYLATGKPIVSTDLPGVRAFREVIRIANNYQEFEEGVVAAFKEDKRLVEKRLALARENSWEKRAQTILKIIDQVLIQKCGNKMGTMPHFPV